MRVPGPRQRRQHRSRANILAAARELVLEKGGDAVSLREVAARAGYSPASLYEYFESKDELLAELASGVLARLSARMAAVPTSLSPARRLVRLGEAYLAFARENPSDYLLLFSRLRSARRASGDVVPASSPYASVLAAAQAGIAAGRFAGLAEDIAYGLWAMVHGMASLQLTHLEGFHADFEAADRAALESYTRGLEARGR
jgi:AcrR family transcriptional regulator